MAWFTVIGSGGMGVDKATERFNLDFGFVMLFFRRVFIGCWLRNTGFTVSSCEDDEEGFGFLDWACV